MLPHREGEGDGDGTGKSSLGDTRLQGQAGPPRSDGDHAIVQGSYGAVVGDAEVVLLLQSRSGDQDVIPGNEA